MTSTIQPDSNSFNNSSSKSQSTNATSATVASSKKAKSQKPIGSWFLKRLGRKPSDDNQSGNHGNGPNAANGGNSTTGIVKAANGDGNGNAQEPNSISTDPNNTTSSWRKSSKSSSKKNERNTSFSGSMSGKNGGGGGGGSSRFGGFGNAASGNASNKASVQRGGPAVDSSSSTGIPVVPGLDSLSQPSKSHGLADTLTIGNQASGSMDGSAGAGTSSPPPQLAGLPEHEPLGMGLMSGSSNRNSISNHSFHQAAKHSAGQGQEQEQRSSLLPEDTSTTSQPPLPNNINQDGKQVDSDGNVIGLSLPGSAAPGSSVAETAPPPLDLKNANGPTSIELNPSVEATSHPNVDSSQVPADREVSVAAAAAGGECPAQEEQNHQRSSSSKDSRSEAEEGDESNSRASTKPTTLMSLETNPGGNGAAAPMAHIAQYRHGDLPPSSSGAAPPPTSLPPASFPGPPLHSTSNNSNPQAATSPSGASISFQSTPLPLGRSASGTIIALPNQDSNPEEIPYVNVPSHSRPHPYNNPNPTGIPSDNASMVTLASSTAAASLGGNSASIYSKNPTSNHGHGQTPSLGGARSIGGQSIGGQSLLDGREGRRNSSDTYASVKALPPLSRRGSDASNRTGRESVAASATGMNSAQAMIGSGGAPSERMGIYRTPSQRTVATQLSIPLSSNRQGGSATANGSGAADNSTSNPPQASSGGEETTDAPETTKKETDAQAMVSAQEKANRESESLGGGDQQ